MFEKFKELAKLREMQKTIQSQKVEVEREGIKIVLNGNMKVEQLQLNPSLNHATTARVLKDLVNEAVDKLQKTLAGLMSGQM
ncbi:MAG: hypothetical protein A3C85_00430 [Candidatus Doudnabacteria bacterium RIFCSPHIGHO2_02_FULL_48_21]|uniref:Nucleoid-associated protein, YbaB/EbfC family n=1 Tax=Candidatus Doudnabacteria bacterium RIFCSPLOWO2_02_FULL_48_13 TaxID=1817845 RepID=A0A1F5QCX1_9BACT|nr:MAG: hypothetical protein A3K05_01110 [Candidatus Doudnabacteria bacterium RIFCSPHIGHO2_01_48_18]OGE79181.1 MAG: hypothetical protein A2668_00380 [Candidatus Doudnabacteria bacterium RIFCSPHIGHO2_01_FULL_48_180]OGE91813.1 MAG: hypothetical protein A3F44_00940 [Candidatus Doudnabacteria bacterium RIFCSPHIGHO2_12_FULL_47_25]OGE93663.1 MAG: hypothetical protein A3C85_00430 [Candidatus Doudnabacteria bacterium RIFCSPHIGHO2_02_FULL_48_21]OGE97944.1 MAG: hypothetical protein A3A83_00615 [Candidatu